jgi:hypothetical protein
MAINYYEILEISPKASTEEIRLAFQRQAHEQLRLIASDDPNILYKAIQKLKLLLQILEVLTDPDNRASYDASLKEKCIRDDFTGQITCPHCGNNHPISSEFCPVTGRPLTPPIRFCPKCGAKQLAGFAFCVRCGQYLGNTGRSEETPPQSPTSQLAQASRFDTYVNVEVKRYGRVEYFTPMDKGHEFPLRIGLILERHARKMLEHAQIKWKTLFVAAQEEEPLIRVIPHSGYFHISPPMRDIKVKKHADVFADFKIVPWQIPEGKDNSCLIDIDFEYVGELIQTIALNVRIQNPYHLGPVSIPHQDWKQIGVIGSAIASFEVAASLFNFINPSHSSLEALIFTSGLIFSALLMYLSLLLWQQAGKRIRKEF